MLQLENKMETLSAECKQKKARKFELEERYRDIQKKMKRAGILMQSLASEQVREKTIYIHNIYNIYKYLFTIRRVGEILYVGMPEYILLCVLSSIIFWG